ncbi:MAG: M48 family metalloprotease [Sulfuricaulis sp.]|nr:M48 family metalloprotease [Sulfuricaulis sp.]
MRHTALQTSLIPLLLTIVLVGFVSGCALNPVSGTPDVVFMSEASEINIGSSNDTKIREQYGVYENPELQAYINRVGQQLAAQSHRPGLGYHFTVLDSPAVNAFALPGGYIYITRGILAYLNSEAELAAVLGHEIGHVTARHGVRQYTAATATGFVGAIIGVATGIGATQDLFNKVFGNAILSGYGRDHELESDRLGAEYLARTGYDPQAVIKVIGVLKNQEAYEKKLAAAENRQPRIYHGVFASHPSADKRLQEVVGEADKFKSLSEPKLAREDYFKQIDKLAFGIITKSSGKLTKGGLLYTNRYYLPEIDLAIDLPSGWSLQQTLDTITATSTDQQSLLQLDVRELEKNVTPDEFLRRHMQLSTLPKGGAVTGLSQTSYTTVLPLATAFSARETRAIVVDHKNRRLFFQGTARTHEGFTAADPVFLATARSLRPLKADEKQLMERTGTAQRLRVIQARPGDTFASLAKKSPLNKNGEDTLRLINNLFPDGEPQAGELIKIIE